MCGFSACISLPGPTSHCNGNGTATNGVTTNGHTTPHKITPTLQTQLQDSVDLINHRGPDDSGIWISNQETVGLAHCRLSINDLSVAGRQPLHSTDQQIHAVVNGEIYDYDRIRQECEAEGYRFQSDSDSELVLALYKIHGAPEFMKHLRGEFAFVLHDERAGTERVIAGRDRYGIKPLVYTTIGSKLLLASEAKAFKAFGWEPRWDVRGMVDGGWMFDERTLFRGVSKVLPGHYLEITGDGIKNVKYWDAEYEDKTKRETMTIEEMITGVREKLVEAVRIRLRADVPVGIYLSGGIDSSAIAGIVTELARKENVKIGNEAATRVTCFSVEFPETSGFDESQIAERTAEWLGVKTIKKSVTEETIAQDFTDAVYHCEHHHFDFNFVAKFALSTLPRDHGVKVVLTGEGADEHFAGYKYFSGEFLREADGAMPETLLAQNEKLRSDMFTAVQSELNDVWSRHGATPASDRPTPPSIAGPGATEFGDHLLAWHPAATLFAPWVQAAHADYDCRQTILNSHPTDVQAKMRSRWHPLHTAMYLWKKNALANVLLSCLGDRTEMAHSVEARTPFLDHHLTEYVNRLPPSVKINYDTEMDHGELGPTLNETSKALLKLNEKWILREAVRPYITDELYKRKKHPFLAPARWAKGGPLHSKFQAILTEEAVEQLGFVDYPTIRDAMEVAWGDKPNPKAFRQLVNTAAWVTLSQRLGVAKADESDWEIRK